MARSAAGRRVARVTGVVTAVAALVAGTLTPAGASVDPHGAPVAPPPHVSRGPAVHGVHPVRFHFHKPRNEADRKYVPRAVTWPLAASARLTLRAPAGRARLGPLSHAARAPVWAQAVAGRGASRAPRALDVRVLGQAQAHAAHVSGVLFAVRAAGSGRGRVRVGLDYRGFAQAYGGNYGSRLVLSELPACALTTPARPACQRAVPLRSANDWARHEVSAEVPVTGAGTGLTGPAVGASAAAGAAPAAGTVVLAA